MNQPTTPETSDRPADATQPVPAALRIRALREVLARMEGANGDSDSATEDVDAATVRAVFREMSAEMEARTTGDPQTLRPDPDGFWTRAEPIPLTQDFDVEVYGTGPYRWEAWAGRDMVASGTARTRLGLWFATTRATIRHARP
jgi:hypothetical protein